MEPHNKAAQIELDKLLQEISLIPKATTNLKKETKIGRSLIIDESDSLVAPKLVSVKKNKPSVLHNHSVKIEEYFDPTPNKGETLFANNILVVSVADEKQEQLAIEKIMNELTMKDTSSIEGLKGTSSSEEKIPTTVPPIPKNSFQFNQEWKKMKNNYSMKYQYLKVIITLSRLTYKRKVLLLFLGILLAI